MQIILKEEMSNLGRMGDVVKVKPGYARNYLIPKGIAVEASTKNLKAMEHQKRVIQDRARKLKKAALDYSDKLSAVKVTISAKAGEEEKLFGSVTTMDIAEALGAQGYDVDKKKIVLEEPIKRLGEYKVEVKLGHDVTASVIVDVVQE